MYKQIHKPGEVRITMWTIPEYSFYSPFHSRYFLLLHYNEIEPECDVKMTK